MIIKVDKEGKGAVEQLCHTVLKLGGLTYFNQVGFTLQAIKSIPKPKKESDKKKK